MIDEETLLRKRILLEDFAAAKLKLQTLQDAVRKEAQALEEVVRYLKRCVAPDQVTALTALAEHLSGDLSELLQAWEDACHEKAMLQQMLSDVGIVVTD